jgi:hypothetical protein
MSAEMTVVVQEGLKKGEVRIEQVAGDVQLVVDSKDTLQALMLGLATMSTSALGAATTG